MSNGATSAATGYLGGDQGPGAWFSSFDHKKIAMMFLGWIMGMFLLGAIFAVNLKLKSGAPGADPLFLHRTMTYHGLIMVFMFLVPAIPSVLGYFLLPLQLGATNMALPMFSRCSLRFFGVGSILMALSLAFGPSDAGWTFGTPFSLTSGGAFAVLAFGLFFMALSWAATGINFVVTVHHKRAAGMGFFDMPILSWALYLTGYVLTVCGLLFGIIILYLASAKAGGKGLFAAGGNPLDWQNYFWFVTTPAAFFALIPAIGVVSEVIVGVSRKALSGYRTVVGSLIALLAVGFISWGVHLIGAGQSAEASFTFAALSLLAVVPVALITYSWLATLYRGAIACAAPTTFTVAFLLNGGIGAVLGLFLASLSVGSYLSSTLFATAHVHYVMMGGVMTAFLAGLHFWWPKLTGRLYNQLTGRAGGILYLIGLNLAFFPQIILGAKGVAAGAPSADPALAGLQNISSVGMALLVVSLVVVTMNLVKSLLDGVAAPANPWGATTLEWQAASPPEEGNFAGAPTVGELYRF